MPRGIGTFVTEEALNETQDFEQLADVKANAKDLYEMRLIFEPEAAALAALRGTEGEIRRILEIGEHIEQEILSNRDRTDDEHAFHRAIAQATHNEFMNKLMPVLYQAISKGVVLSEKNEQVKNHTMEDHRMIMEFYGTEKSGRRQKCNENPHTSRNKRIKYRVKRKIRYPRIYPPDI
ncbi:FadR/GntR family transcriptional regulator [Hungatella hathewayi]|uniref:FadR/GntR family transcriptional regulator n=1 Tax=Hungatella hathewayi TaxID=154046 RepID=UPI00356215A9